MQQTLELGIGAFSDGRYDEAVAAFEQLEKTFGAEPEYLPLLRRLLPAWAYSYMQQGSPADAVKRFEDFLKRYPDETRQRRFVLYSLAQSHERNDNPKAAIDAYERFIREFPNTSEANLARMRVAEQYFAMDRIREGIEVLQVLARNDEVPDSIKVRARLVALQRAQEIGDNELANAILLEQPWTVTRMPEMAILTFGALRAGDSLIDAKAYDLAIQAYRLVPPRDFLITAQRRRLEELKTIYRERAPAAMRSRAGKLWAEYYQALIGRVEGQLNVLEGMEDYTPGFLLRQGQALQLMGRLDEAWVLYATLAEQDGFPEDARGTAHYNWILTAYMMEAWEDALRIARLFVERRPNDPLAPSALYMIAKTYQEQGRYSLASPILDDLLKAYPDHPLASRWLFTRGLNAAMLDQPEAARRDFTEYLRLYPQGQLQHNARYWHALTRFFEKDYAAALEEWQAGAKLAAGHPLYPEIQYRIASARYAMRDHPAALRGIMAYLREYPDHARAPEAQVLKGDILMGMGELDAAIDAFQQAGPEAGSLFTYAVFQIGKIHRAREDYGAMRKHFTHYLERDDLTVRPRAAEAVHWVGWTYAQEDNPLAALPVYWDALDVYGNDPQSGETDGLLQGLRTLHQRFQRTGLKPPAELADADFFKQEDYFRWIEAERNRALEAGRMTQFARYSVYLSKHYEQTGYPSRATTALLEVVNVVEPELLDAEALALAGLALADMNSPAADDYFTRLLKQHPGSPHRGHAFFGKAMQARARGDLDAADVWLRRLRQELPLHPRVIPATLEAAEIALVRQRPDEMVEPLENLLRLKQARGLPHARALNLLGASFAAQDDAAKAIAYHQRVYTLYRGFPEMVAEAYLRSALLFEQIGDTGAATRTLAEFIGDDSLAHLPAYREAEVEYARLTQPETTTGEERSG